MLVFTAMMTLSAGAFSADDPLSDTPTPYLIYKAILGGIVDIATFNEPTVPVDGVLSSMFLVFNLSVFTVLTWYIMLIMLQKVVESGNSGEIQSKKYDDTMSIMRTSLSIAGLLPVIKGFCVAQVAVVFLAIQASFIADKVNYAGNQTAFVQGALTSYSVDTAETDRIILDIFKSVICATAMRTYYSSHPKLETDYSISIVDKSSTISDTSSASFLWQYENNLGVPICGSFSMSISDDKYFGNYSDPTGTWGAMSSEQIALRDRIILSHKNAVLSAHNAIIDSLSSGLFIPGQAIDADSIYSTYKDLKLSYNEELQRTFADAGKVTQAEWDKRIQDMYDSSSSIYSAQRGWIYNGSTWMEKGRSENFLSKITSQFPSSSSPMYDRMDQEFIREALDISDKKTFDTISENQNDSDDQSFSLKRLLKDAVSKADVKQVISSVSNYVVNGLLVETQFDFKNYDPLTNLQHFGHRLIVTGFTMLGLAVSTEVAAEAIGGEGARSSWIRQGLNFVTAGLSEGAIAAGRVIAENIAGLLFTIAPLFIAIGSILAYWLPSLPLFMWDMAVLGNYLLVLVAFMAAPLWVAANAAPGGDGFTSDNARQGFLTMITILARPSIMVMTWHVAIILMKEMGYYVSLVLDYAPNTNAGTTTILWGSLMMVLVLLIFEIVITLRCTSLIYEVPDQMPIYYGSSNTTAHENIGENKATSMVGGWQSQVQSGVKDNAAQNSS
jgi:conjugal transfer/type IV secretion protein DotA/TraY